MPFCSQGFRAQKTEGNLNNEIGLPLTPLRMTRETEVHGRRDGHEPFR